MPTCVTRVRVIGRYTGYSSNFIVKVGGRLLVNELLGTITNSSGVQWSFTEVKQ